MSSERTPGFHVETLITSAAATVRVAGDVDMASVERLTAALREAVLLGVSVRIDLADATFFGSEGVHALVDAEDGAATAGAELVVVEASPIVRRTLEISRLEHLLVEA
jgi:anti-anti-sigma factor